MAMLPLETGAEAETRAQPGKAWTGVRPAVEPVPGEVELDLGRLVKLLEAEARFDLVEHPPVNDVELHEWRAAEPHLVHRGLVFVAPCIGEIEPVERIAERLEDAFRLARDPGAPVDHGAEHVKEQRLHIGHRVGRRLRANWRSFQESGRGHRENRGAAHEGATIERGH